MAPRALPAVLVFAALLSDLGQSHGVALGLLLAAIPASFMLALDCYGDSLEARCGGTRPLLAGLALFMLVLSAALRSPAVVGGVPQLAVSALVVTLVLYATIGLSALMPTRAVRVTAPR
jgi:hypothetical protein